MIEVRFEHPCAWYTPRQIRSDIAALLRYGGFHRQSMLSVLFTSPAEITRLNTTYRGVVGPTNILSFRYGEATDRLDGELILAPEVVEREAAEIRCPVSDYVVHLLVHGILHIAGAIHDTDQSARAMAERAERILCEYQKNHGSFQVRSDILI